MDVDLREQFERLDGERTFNLIDAVLLDDMIYGAALEGDGLEKMRIVFTRLYSDSADAAPQDVNPGVENPSLYRGKLLTMDDNGGLGLAEAPLA